MEIEVRIDEKYQNTKVVIETNRVTDEIQCIIERIKNGHDNFLTGFRGSAAYLIDPKTIINVVARGDMVTASTIDGEYRLRMRLYEVEDKLDPKSFLRISRSEIMNIHQVAHFDLSRSGDVCVLFRNGATSYVSRRCLPQIRRILDV